MNTWIARILVSIGVVVTAVPVAIAQSAIPPSHGRMDVSRQYQQRPFSLPSERVEARLTYIKTALKISEDQESQWSAYADVMRKLAREADERIETWRSWMKDRRQRPRPTAIERLERRQSFHAAALRRLNEILAAATPLYEVLTPDQKLVADRMLVPRPRRLGHEGWRRR
ncbi:MAG: Spy/CpxP family protein refolding chaperone [Betaproteobacteria bacterium]|nr:Spy/CpxP family protein refolding chaperone [Betaproteobacteria bacterium]